MSAGVQHLENAQKGGCWAGLSGAWEEPRWPVPLQAGHSWPFEGETPQGPMELDTRACPATGALELATELEVGLGSGQEGNST